MDSESRKNFLHVKIPEMLRCGGFWNVDKIVIDEIEEYCEENGFIFISICPYASGDVTPLISFVLPLWHSINDTLLSETVPRTAIEKHRLIKEFTQSPLTSLYTCFEYLIKSHKQPIILHARCNKYFPMEDETMEAIHNILKQNRNSIALIFSREGYDKDYINHLKFEQMDKPVYFSYRHTGDAKKYAEIIVDGLKKDNINFSIDAQDLDYRNEIREYEEEIGKGARCIVIVTPEYLESPHCMYELTQIVKHGNLKKRVYPVVDTGKYTRDSRGLNLLKNFWMQRREETLKILKSDPSPFTARELSDIETFINKLDDLWTYLHDINTRTIEELTKDNAAKLISEIRKDIEQEVNTGLIQNLSTDEQLFSPNGMLRQSTVNQYGNNPIHIEKLNGNLNINNSGN